MKSFSQEHWTITLPDDWIAENEVDYISLYHPDGVGDLLISTFQHEDTVTDDDLEEFAADHINCDVESEDIECGDFAGFSFCYDVENEYLCEWYLKSDNIMLFITYSCALKDEENSEEDIVDTILDSLQRQ